MKDQAFLTINEIINRYKVHRNTIENWIKSPKIAFPPPVIINVRKRLWRAEDLEAWERRKTAVAPWQ